MEDWSRGGDGISRERCLGPACKCKALGGISNGQPMWEPLSIAHGNGGGIQPRILVDKAFSVPKCVRLAPMSHHSHRILRKILGTVPRAQRDDLSEIWGEELLSLGDENTSNFEKQNAIGKPMNSVPAQEENDMTHEKMMKLEPLLEASGERNLRNIEITHGDCPCHCLAQTVWYPEHSNLC